MKVYLFVGIIVLFFTDCTKDSGDTTVDPITIEEEHFTYVLHDGLPQSIVPVIQSRLAENYARVLSDLEVSSMNNVTVKIWDNESNFQEDMFNTIGMNFPGATGWVAGPYDIRILNRGEMAQTVLHEFCHCVSLLVNPTIGNNPRWLWEAVALYEAGEFVDPNSLGYLIEGDFPTLSELNTDYNSSNHNIYQVGYLLAEYIVEEWSNESFVELIRSNGNLQETLNISTQEFEAGWKEFVTQNYL